MYPDRVLVRADRSYQRSTIGSDIHALFFSCAEGDLFRRAIRKALPPDVRATACIGGKIHELPVWRPSCARTPRGTNFLSFCTAVEGRHPALPPQRQHLHVHCIHQELPVIWRKKREMI